MNTWLLTVFGTLSVLLVLGFLVWVGWKLLARTEDAWRLVVKWVVSVVLFFGLLYCARLGPFGVLGAAVMGVILGIMWAPNLAGMLAAPLTGALDGGAVEVELRPYYSMAIGKRKQGRYDEAMAEVRKQLGRFPGDFEGMMLLAEMYADDFKEPASALQVIEELVAQPDLPAQRVAFALNRSADWHLKFDRDPDLARMALERIVSMCPDTEQAQLALQRIAHLTPEEMIKEREEPHRIALRAFEGNIGLQANVAGVAPIEEDPAMLANRYVQQLEKYPHDNETREKLAVVYADHYQRLDLAAEQLEQLISAPNQQSKHVAHWLNLLAELQIRFGTDTEVVRQTLRRIVDRFPKSAYAETAMTRIAYLNLESRKTKTSQALKLGSYEQNIGLKSRTPTSGGAQSE